MSLGSHRLSRSGVGTTSSPLVSCDGPCNKSGAEIASVPQLLVPLKVVPVISGGPGFWYLNLGGLPWTHVSGMWVWPCCCGGRNSSSGCCCGGCNRSSAVEFSSQTVGHVSEGVVGTETKASKKKKGKQAILSLRVSRLNAGIPAEALSEGLRLSASVRSVEDHGYLLTLGIPVRLFSIRQISMQRYSSLLLAPLVCSSPSHLPFSVFRIKTCACLCARAACA